MIPLEFFLWTVLCWLVELAAGLLLLLLRPPLPPSDCPAGERKRPPR